MSIPPAEPVTIVTPHGKLIGLAVICALFAAMGVIILLLAPTETLNLIVGVGALAFFGIGGGISIISQWRRSVVLRADDTGLVVGRSNRVAWSDVDRIGGTATLLGLRLSNSAAYLEHAPKDVTRESLRATRAETGWDLTWPAAVLDRPPREAAAALTARRPR